MRITSFVLLALASIAEAGNISARCETSKGADDPALLAIKVSAKTSRALLSTRGSFAEGVFCNRFVEHVCPAITDTVDTTEECKDLKKKKGPLKKACYTFFYKEPYLVDPVGYKTCNELADTMSKSCQNEVKSKGEFVVEDCKAALEAKYECEDFCGIFVKDVCDEVAVGPWENKKEQKKSCKASSKNGKNACKIFGKNPKGNLAKHSKQCKKIMKPMENACEDTNDNDRFDVDDCKEVLYENYNCNPCAGQKPVWIEGFDNKNCFKQGVVDVMEQSGINVTLGYQGGLSTQAEPINTTLAEAGLCVVNVHWHLGTEHYSHGEFDASGKGPRCKQGESCPGDESSPFHPPRLGFQCKFYNASDPKFTPYNFQHCKDVHVGETYEVHWPHSDAGDCFTEWQYQTPFYDGVFCKGLSALNVSTQSQIGVQAQVFTIFNDPAYENYFPNLFKGMIVDGTKGQDLAYYTGSTTGTSRSNVMCSSYTPITWQVDRKCHLISAASFDKMCEDMKQQSDDMSKDLWAHGSRELVITPLAADNVESSVWK